MIFSQKFSNKPAAARICLICPISISRLTSRIPSNLLRVTRGVRILRVH
jgi:hypothetical protein